MGADYFYHVYADAWARPSSTSLLLAWDSTRHTLQPFEHLSIDSVSPARAVVSGYYYVVYSPADSIHPIGYWGTDSMSVLHSDSFRFDYTLLISDTSLHCKPVIHTRIENLGINNTEINFYPNPTNRKGELSIFADNKTTVQIDVYDMEGQHIETIYNGIMNSGNTKFQIDVDRLSSGMYMILYRSDTFNKTIKFTKL